MPFCRTRPILVVAGLLIGSMLVAACGDSVAPEELVGEWAATSINGTAIPGTVIIAFDGGFDSTSVQLDSMVIEFNSGTTCNGFAGETGGGGSAWSCTYALSGSTVVLTILDLDNFEKSGPVDGNTMTLTDEDTNVYVLRQR